MNTPATDINARALTDQDNVLRDIFAAVISCNTSIITLTNTIKGVKLKLNMVTQDMQKLRDRTAALENSEQYGG